MENIELERLIGKIDEDEVISILKKLICQNKIKDTGRWLSELLTGTIASYFLLLIKIYSL